MKNSIIKRVPNCFYFQIAEDYQALCIQEKNGKLTPNDCAAAMLSLFENLVNSRIIARAKNPLSFPASTNYIRKCLLGHYSNNSIIESLSFLENESYINIKRAKTDKNNNLPNEITLNTEHINYMLGEYCKIKVVQNYITPYAKLNNPLCKIEQGGYSNLKTELSTKNNNKEIIKETLSHSFENFNFEKKQNDIPLIENQNQKEEKPATITKNEISGNEINYDKFVERVRELVQLDNEEKRRRYITNMGVKPSNEKANEILHEEFKRYAAKRFGDGCNFHNNHERLMKWLEDSSRIGFSDFNLWTCSQYAVQNAAAMIAMMKDKPAKVQAQEKKVTGGFSQLIKK